jgi:hypothetical protein
MADEAPSKPEAAEIINRLTKKTAEMGKKKHDYESPNIY